MFTTSTYNPRPFVTGVFIFIVFCHASSAWAQKADVGKLEAQKPTTETLHVDTLNRQDNGEFETVETVRIRKKYKRIPPPPAFIYEIKPSIGLVQTAFSNWVEGGTNVFTWGSGLDISTKYLVTKWDWRTATTLAYGQTRIENGAFRKTTDIIDLATSLTYLTGNAWSPQFSASLRTQFAPGFDFRQATAPQVSAFFDPAYSLQSLGASYTPNENYKFSLGVAAREIFTSQFTNFADNRATPEIENINIRFGFELYQAWLIKLFDGVTFRTRTRLFAPFANLGALELNQKFTLFLKVNEWLDARLTTILLYQENVTKNLQVQQNSQLTLTFRIANGT
jgi:hypothetical protein